MVIFTYISMHVGIDRDESYSHVRPLSRSLSLSCHPLGPFYYVFLCAICVYRYRGIISSRTLSLSAFMSQNPHQHGLQTTQICLVRTINGARNVQYDTPCNKHCNT